MNFVGINSVMRKLASTMTTTVQLVKKDDGHYSLNSTILFLTTSQKFHLGVEKDVTTQDGRKVKNVFTIEGQKLIEHQIGEKIFSIVRDYSEEELVVTTTMNGVTSTSWCKVVE